MPPSPVTTISVGFADNYISVSASPTYISGAGRADGSSVREPARTPRAWERLPVPVPASFDPDRGPNEVLIALNFLLMLRGASRQTKSQGTADRARQAARQRPCHPCLGCGAFSIKPWAQFSVQSFEGTPSRFQNWVVAYSAWTGWPAPPARVLSVLGRLATLNASLGAAQMRSPVAQISSVLLFSAPKPPGRGPVMVRPSPDNTGTSCRVISAPSPGGLGPTSLPTPSWRRPSAI